jgi:hypothetical protein
MPLTPEEQLELDSLESEAGTVAQSGLSIAEQQELDSLNSEGGFSESPVFEVLTTCPLSPAFRWMSPRIFTLKCQNHNSSPMDWSSGSESNYLTCQSRLWFAVLHQTYFHH